MRAVVAVLKQVPRNARNRILHNVRAAIMWIVLRQARHFGRGNMIAGEPTECLGEFSHLLNQLNAMALESITYADIPDALLHSEPTTTAPTKRPGTGTSPTQAPKKAKTDLAREPYNPDMGAILTQPYLDAHKPAIKVICTYCGITPATLLPDHKLDKDCTLYTLFGSCPHGNDCNFHHKTATPAQVEAAKTKLKRFIDDPAGCKRPCKF